MTTEAAPSAAPADTQLTTVATELDLIKKINDAIAGNTTASDIRISRLAILQQLSPEITSKIPGYEVGMIVDNLTREVVSTYDLPPWLLAKGVKPETLKPVHFCLMAFNFKLPTEYIEWIKRDEQVPGGPRWNFKTLDVKDPRVGPGIWKSHGGSFEGKKPPVTINTNYLGLCLNEQMKIPNGYFRVATFARSSAGCGSTLASIMQAHAMQNQKPWERAYYLYTVNKPLPKTHEVFQIAPGPLLKDVAEPFVSQMCLDMGRSLVGTAGQIFQTMLINAAVTDEDSHDGDAGDTGTTQSASEDPFANPAGGGSTPSQF